MKTMTTQRALRVLTVVSLAQAAVLPGRAPGPNIPGAEAAPMVQEIQAQAVMGGQSEGHKLACVLCFAVSLVTVGTGIGVVLWPTCGFVCGLLFV